MAPRNLDQLTRVYGPTTWDVYDRLDESPAPAGPDDLHALAAGLLRPGARVLDAGCRDAAHLVRLVWDNDVTGVGVEPVPVHVERARAAVRDAGLDDRVTIVEAMVHDLDDAAPFDLVWCRDVLTQVDDLDGFLAALVHALAPGGHVLTYATFATDRLDGHDAAMLDRHLGNVPGGTDRARVEAAFERVGLQAVTTVEVGSEWAEHAEERTGWVRRDLLRLSRLRRQRDAVIAAHGRDVYDHVEANLHWGLFVLTGKLAPVVHVLAVRA